MTNDSHIQQLLEGKKELTDKVIFYKKEFSKIPLPRNYALMTEINKKKALGSTLYDKRNKMVEEYQKIQERIIAINKQLKQAGHDKDHLYYLIQELTTEEQWNKIKFECRRRKEGKTPATLPFNFKTIEAAVKDAQYRPLAKMLLEKLISSRMVLTDIIREGCHRYGNADFLTLISPLNRSIESVQELDKIKRQNSL